MTFCGVVPHHIQLSALFFNALALKHPEFTYPVHIHINALRGTCTIMGLHGAEAMQQACLLMPQRAVKRFRDLTFIPIRTVKEL